MTDSSNQKTSLDDLKTKIDIVSSLVQESHRIFVEHIKLLVMFSITLNGGAIMLVANNKMEDVYVKCMPFIDSIIVSIARFVVMPLINSLEGYTVMKICTSANFQKSLYEFHSSTRWLNVVIFIAYVLWACCFLNGVGNVFGSILDYVKPKLS